MGTTSNHETWTDRLSEYVDGELEAREREDLDVHLAHCPECRQVVEELHAVTRRARTLEDRAPVADLWPAIATGIAAPAGPWARRFSFTLPQLAAAALALMVLSGSMVWMARIGGDRTDFPAIDAAPEPRRVHVTLAHSRYDAAILDLQDRLDGARERLDPQTLRVVQENLSVIDRAIEQCDAALARDPADSFLGERLAAVKKRKLALLRHATTLAGSP